MDAQAKPMPRTFSARLKIGLAFSALAAMAFTMVGFLSGLHARQQLERNTGEALYELARNVALNLDMGLFERYREITNLATLQSQLDQDLDERAWFEVVETMRASLPEYSWIGITDARGQVIAATGRMLQGQNVSARPWFVQGWRSAYVGDLHEALLLSRLLPPAPDGAPLRFLDFSAPLVRDGRTIGVIGAHLSWAWAQARCHAALSSLNRTFDVDVAVFDAAGREVLRSPTQHPPYALPPRVLDEMVKQRFRIVTWEDGERYLSASVRTTGFGDYKGLGWTLVVRQPQDQAFATAASLERSIWIAGAIGALLFGVLGWFLASGLTAPLRAVAARAREVAASTGITLDGDHERDEVGQLASSLGSLLAQLHQREQELRTINDQLEARVAERTESLSVANAEMESFSRSISHDLKAPIGTMGAMLRQIMATRREAMAERDQQILSALAQECDRLRELVDGMLSLSMVDRRPIQGEDIDMTELAETVVQDLRQVASLSGAQAPSHTHTEVVIEAMPTHVQGDPVLLRQVWQNLLSNAFKFSARVAQPRIELGGHEDPQGWTFWVKDNGPGFDPMQAQALFEAFQRLPQARTFQGTGVGLSIVRKVMQRHGGRVWCEAKPGQGAQFYFWLPRQASSAATGEDAGHATPMAEHP